MTPGQSDPASANAGFAALAALDQAAMDALPQAVYLCASDGRVVRFNRRAAELWGRTPAAGDAKELYCGSFRLYRTNGAVLPHDQCPMAAAVKTGASFHDEDVVIEQPDGQRVVVRVNIAALKDAEGKVQGAINCFEDISAQKRAEDLARVSAAQLSDEISALTKLTEASSRLWQARTLADGLDEMLGASIELLGADMGNIQILDETRGVLLIAAQRGFAAAFLDFFREVSADDDSACGRALRTGERLVVEDVEADAPFAPMRHITRAAGYRAVQSTPLIGRDGAPLGMISTHWAKVYRPSEQDLRRLDLYARQAADFIERNRIEETARQRREEAETQNEIARALSGERDLQALLQLVTDAGTKLACAQFGAFFYTSAGDRGETCLPYTLAGAPRATVEMLAIPCTPLFEPTLQGRSWRIADAFKDPQFAQNARPEETAEGDLPIRSYLTVPVVSRSGEVLGGLFFGHAEPGRFTERAERLVAGIAAQAAVAIDNWRLNQSLQSELDVRKTVEAALRGSERRFREMIDALPAAVYTTDAEGRITHFNPAAVAFAGRAPKLGSDEWCVSWKLYHPDGAPMPHDQCPMAVALKEGSEIRGAEAIAERPDGSRVWFTPYPTPLRDEAGRVTGAINMLVDITERKRAEEVLRESEERFRVMADNISQLAWTCDRLGDVTWYNKRWLDYTGLSFEAMKDWGWKEVLHPDHVERVSAGVARSRDSGEPWDDTFLLRSNQGQYRWFLSRAVPIRNDAGEIVRWFGTNTDVTELREAEEMQRMLTGELSHRVKNMLATVQAIASQTLRHNGDPAQFVANFRGRIQSMSRVHALLSSGNWRAADLREIIRDQLLLGPVDETRVTAWGPSVELEPQMATHAALMLHELGTNSIKYGALSKKEGVVTLGWTVSDDVLRLQWAERGGPAVKAPIRRGFGTTLIEQSAKSAGGGATMSIGTDGVRWEITLPLPRHHVANQTMDMSAGAFVDASPQQQSAKGQDHALPSLAGKRFLIVEDEPLVAMDMAAILEQAGAEIAGSAGAASDALALIERTQFDAALLDANLAGSPVNDIAIALTRQNVPFAFVTGYGRDGLPEAFAAAELLSKPFNHQQLLETAARLVRLPAKVRKLRD